MSKPNKKTVACLQNIQAVIASPDWLTTDDATVAVITRLHGLLAELSSLQRPFVPVDADLPLEVRSRRLLEWLKTAPAFKAVDVAIEENRVKGKANRGVVAKEAIKQGELVMRIPPDCMLDTELAWLGGELRELVQDSRFELASVFPLLLAVVGMVEHAKCVEKGLAPGAPALLAVPPVQPRSALRAPFRGAPDDDVAAGGEAAVSAPHGHSHGGAPCHGHGGHGHAAPQHHGHSHGGGGGAAASSSHGSHGHSHGGAPCDGHGHGPHGAPVPRSALDLTHPWGSPMRAFLSILPSPSELEVAVYYTPAHFEAARG